MTPDQAARIVRLVEYGWTNGQFEPEHAVVYLDGVSDLPFETTDHALRRLIRTDRFRPAVADIRLEVARLSGMLPPALPDAVDQAVTFIRYIDDSQWTSGALDEPAVHPAVKAAVEASGASPTWSWEGAFRRVYAEITDTTEREIIANQFTLPALEQPRD